ncbi:unnamed protein product, partial [Mesorhabditis belari]|uniref:Minichromosome loss protein Mcl1 middle region domain-containing protein n=1 Tax=Mesorhabditis belari TaxID=2138241 RepID=A0AAF3FTQ0_9BILA
MAPRFSELREAHSGGENVTHVDLAIAPDGKEFATCSKDGSVWVWKIDSFNDLEPPAIHEVADGTHSTLCWREHLYMGVTTTDLVTNIEKRSLSRLSADPMMIDKTLMLFAMEINSIDVSKEYIVAVCSDCTLKKAPLADTTNYEKIEFDGQPLSVAIDPLEKFVAVTCTDGTLSVYPVVGIDRLAHFERLFRSFGDIGPRHTRAQVRWSSDGSFLYVATQGSVRVVKVDEWELLNARLSSDELKEEIFSSLALSTSGKYLAAGTLNGKICIWETATKKLITMTEHRHKGSLMAISSLAFDPANDSNLCMADIKEGVSILYQALDKKEVPAPTNFSRVQADLSDDEDNVITRPRRSKFLADEAMGSGGNSPSANFGNEDENTRMSVDLGAIKRQFGQFDNLEDDIDSREMTMGRSNYNQQPVYSGPPVVTFKPPILPKYFPSGGVPERTTDGHKHKNRYLKWNRFGVIRYLKNDDGCLIEIEYHDVSISSEISIPNDETKYTMGDLCAKAIVLANRPKKEDQSSELLVINLLTWDREKTRWNVKLPVGEIAVDVLVTDTLIAALTEKGNIRVFSLEGTQRQIISHAGVLSTSAAFGDTVAIVSPFGGPQWMEDESDEVVPFYAYQVTIYDIKQRNSHLSDVPLSKTVPLPVGKPGGKVFWMGFTNRGNLVSMDSSGCVRLLSPSDLWIPIFDGAARLMSISDSIWPISIIETPKCEIRYAYCRGSKVPLMEMRLVPTTDKWELPVCDKGSDKTKLEGELLLNELKMTLNGIVGEDSQTLINEHSKALIQLFTLALKMEREGRAVELTQFSVSSKAVQALIKYAAKQNRGFLVDKLTTLGNELQEKNEEDEGRRRPSTISRPAPVLVETRQRDADEIRGFPEIGPKKVVLKKRESAFSGEATLMALNRSRQPQHQEDGENEKHLDEVTQHTDTTLNTQAPVPYTDTPKANPFSKNGDFTQPPSSANSSLFEQLDSPWDRKRARDKETPSSTPQPKQARLAFGSSNKENAGAYGKWYSANEVRLRKDFRGEEIDFEKFCAQSFRMLTPAQKKEWKARVEQE